MNDQQQRADYILCHFWDDMDFKDSARSHDEKFLEANIVNFISLFPHRGEPVRARSIAGLLGYAAVDAEALRLVSEIMERYLADPNSPMRSEPDYILFLKELLKLPTLPEEARVRYGDDLSMAQKNLPGTTATDFAYIDSESRRQTLHDTAAKRLLLVFYDPECDHCTEILRQVRESRTLNECIATGELRVLAVYTEGKRELWEQTKGEMPQTWITGCDLSGIVERELYAVPAMPIMYLLDADKRVLLKDALLPAIERRLRP